MLWEMLVTECDKIVKANTNSVKLKFSKAQQIRKCFVNPKTENEDFGQCVNYNFEVWISELQKQSFADVLTSEQVILNISQCSLENAGVAVSFNKYTGLKDCKFIKKRLQHRCFPVKFAKFLRSLSFKEHIRWLLLEISYELSLYCI